MFQRDHPGQKNGHKNWLCQLDRLYNWVERVETTTHLDIVAGTWLRRSEQPSFSKRQLDLRSSSVLGRDEFDKAGWTAGLDWVKNVWLGWAVRYHSQRIHVWNIYLHWDYFKLL